MKSRARRAGYNLGTRYMASNCERVSTLPRGPKPLHLSALTAGPKACAAQKLKCRSLPLVGMTNFVLVGVLILGVAGSASAASAWADSARELARKIAEITGPGAVAVEVGNRSSLSKADVAAVRASLETELAGRGVHLAASDQAAASVAVTLSENVREYVWVAEVRVGKNEKSVVMVALPRPEAGAVPAAGSGVVLRKQLLWTQEEAILDVVMLDSPDRNSGVHMAVLDGSKVSLEVTIPTSARNKAGGNPTGVVVNSTA